MKLLIDSGNTKCKFATVIDNTVENLESEVVLSKLNSFVEIIYSDVANSAELQALLQKVNTNKTKVTRVQVTKEAFGITCAYESFQTLGIDRWLAIIAAEQLFPAKNLIIVDAGTAITVDILTANRQHLGGWIVPGIKLMEKSITDKAPNVFTAPSVKSEVFGTSTPSALINGCMNAALGLIEQARLQFETQTKDRSQPIILITGGDAQILSEHLKQTHIVNKSLVFLGLARFSN